MDAFVNVRQVKTKPLAETNDDDSITSSDRLLPLSELNDPRTQTNDQQTSERLLEQRLLEIKKRYPNIDSPIQHISFSSPFISSDYKLLEVDNKLLEEISQPGGELVIRGKLSDFVVACTPTRTFQVKECETSNSLLLLPELADASAQRLRRSAEDGDASVVAVCKTYLELVEVTSSFSPRLREILTQHVLDLTDDQAAFPPALKWEYLLDEIQLSETQLREALARHPLIQCEEGLYLLNETSRQRILDEIVEICDDMSTPDVNVNRIHPKALSDNLLSFSERLREPIAQWFFDKFCDQVDDDADRYYSVNEERLCRARASEILRSDRKKDFPVELFLRLVERILPTGFQCRLDWLTGIAFMDENLVTGRTMRSLQLEDLHDQPRKRLEELFALKTLWTRAEIEPYVSEFCSNTSNIEQFLMRHCRIVTKEDGKFFTLKQF